MDYSDTIVQLCALDPQGKVQVNRACRNDWKDMAKAVEGRGIVLRGGTSDVDAFVDVR